MEEVFFVVVTKRSGQHTTDTEMRCQSSERMVIAAVGAISSAGGVSDDYDTKVERIFKVDEFGNVAHYQVVYREGRLRLEAGLGVK